jgi:hypothetical protein
MITDYTVITACDQMTLVEAVHELIQEGWTPLGGVCLAYERNIQRSITDERFLAEDIQHYAQALIKLPVVKFT